MIPDVRFQHELDVITGSFQFNRPFLNDRPHGKIISVRRILDRQIYLTMKANNVHQHSSERGLHLPKDFIPLWNDGTINELKIKIDQGLSTFYGKHFNY